jgi:ABC-2 type transport system permease protein
VLLDPSQRPMENIQSFLPGYLIILFYSTVLLGNAGLLLSSLGRERENRTLEMLFASARPIEILGGKMTGLCLVGLGQMATWLCIGLLVGRLGGRPFQMPAEFALTPAFLLWGIAFFLGGFTFYSSLLSILGVLAYRIRIISQIMSLVTLPLFVPVFLLLPLTRDPNGTLAVVFSLVPFTTSEVMMMRMNTIQVPVWQPLVALAILVVSTVGMVRLGAWVFRTQMLMTGQPVELDRLLRAVFHRR